MFGEYFVGLAWRGHRQQLLGLRKSPFNGNIVIGIGFISASGCVQSSSSSRV
jgi:hypothetical protein